MKLVRPEDAGKGEGLRYVAPTWAFDGMPVFAPVQAEGRVGLVPCRVVTAMGTRARVVCDEPEVDTWFDLHELRVPVQDPKP